MDFLKKFRRYLRQLRTLLLPEQFKLCCHSATMVIFVTACSMFPEWSTAQSPSVSMEYDVKAAFLYKFAQYVKWPEDAFEKDDDPVVFGIAAPENIVDLVRSATRGRTVQGRSVTVKPIANINSDTLHLLFISRSREDQMQPLLHRVYSQPALVVTESDNGLDAGGIINFDIEQERVRFDINQATAENQGLQIGAQLLKVAREVRRSR